MRTLFKLAHLDDRGNVKPFEFVVNALGVISAYLKEQNAALGLGAFPNYERLSFAARLRPTTKIAIGDYTLALCPPTRLEAHE